MINKTVGHKSVCAEDVLRVMPEWKKKEIENLNRVLEERAKLPPQQPTEPWYF